MLSDMVEEKKFYSAQDVGEGGVFKRAYQYTDYRRDWLVADHRRHWKKEAAEKEAEKKEKEAAEKEAEVAEKEAEAAEKEAEAGNEVEEPRPVSFCPRGQDCTYHEVSS